jgi:hypothetical protein
LLDRTRRQHLARRARDARYRERRRQGQRIAKGVYYNAAIVDLLIAARALREEDACDDRKVGAAIVALLLASARH